MGASVTPHALPLFLLSSRSHQYLLKSKVTGDRDRPPQSLARTISCGRRGGSAQSKGPGKVAAMPDDRALHVLRGVLTRLRSQAWERDRWDTSRTHAARDLALVRYDRILAPERVGGLDKETFLAFLRFQNKRHAMGLGRGVAMAADMPRLREAVGLLVDERLPLRARLDRLRPHGGEPMVKGLGPSVITAILHFADPGRYGILNGASERVLRRLGLYPEVPGTASLGERYEAVNRVLLRLAAALGIDLGLLDALWWRVPPHDLAGFAVPQPGTRRPPLRSRNDPAMLG
jgi:hypothetical protein